MPFYAPNFEKLEWHILPLACLSVCVCVLGVGVWLGCMRMGEAG